MGNREERNEYATAKWDAEEVRRQASSEQRRHSDRRRQAKRNRTIIYLACVVLVSCLLAGIGWLLVNDVCSLNKPYTEVEITVEEGDSRGDVAKKLHDAGLVNSRLVFNIAGTFLHYNRYVEPGTYKLNSDMDFRALITNMHDWETDAKEAQGLIKVTIPEGYTVREIIDLLAEKGVATKAELETVVQLLNPFAPHMTEELWEKLGHSHDEQLAYYPWPKYEEAKCVESTVEIAVQVNGKVKARLKVAADIDAAAAIAAAKADPAVAAALEGKQLVKEIYVKGRLVNLAAKG